MAKNTRTRSYPRRSRSRSGSTSVVVSAIVAAAAVAWYFWGDELGLPSPTGASTETSAPEIPAAPKADPPPTSTAEGDTLSGTASVIDADTLDIHSERIRLVGVDAPESHQKCLDANDQLVRCGAISANALHGWINRNPVSCAIEGHDRYKRSLGKCTVRGASMQDWLVRNGYAVAYRTYSKEFIPAEDAARKNKAGLWAGTFVMPWDWRKGQRLPAEISLN